MIRKDHLKLSEIASYSKLARESKAPRPLPPGGIGLRTLSLSPNLDVLIKECAWTVWLNSTSLNFVSNGTHNFYHVYDFFSFIRGPPKPEVSRSHAGCTVREWKTPSRFQRFLSRSLVLRWRWSLNSQTHLCIRCLIWRYSVLLGISHLKVQCVIMSGPCLTLFWKYSTVCRVGVTFNLKVHCSVCMDVSEIIYAIHSEYFVFADWSEIQGTRVVIGLFNCPITTVQ